jgi:O-antigen ligase
LIHFRKEQFVHFFKRDFLILQAIFIVATVGILYSSNKDQAISDLSRQFSICLFPILLSLFQIDLRKYHWQLLFAFSFANTLTVIYLFIDAFHTIFYYNLTLSSLFTASFDNHNFSQPIHIHATYLSMYVALSLVFMLQQFIEIKKKNGRKLFYGLFSIILAAGLIQLSSRSVFFAILLILNVAFPFIVSKSEHRLKQIIINSLCTAITLLILFNTTIYKERFFNTAKADLSDTKKSETLSEPRAERWKVALQLFKQKPLIGHGSGTEISLLKEEYYKNKMYSSYLNELNAHNQYISLLIKTGCIGLGIYLYVIFWGINQAIRKRDILFLSFLIIIITVSITENILDVNKGIFYFSFFFCFLIIYPTPLVKKFVPIDPI